MTKYLYDTCALIELIKGNEKYKSYESETYVTSALNIAELYFILAKEKNETYAQNILAKIPLHCLPITAKIGEQAGKFRYRHIKSKLSYADCIGYILAQEHGISFLTSDGAFKGQEGVTFIPL